MVGRLASQPLERHAGARRVARRDGADRVVREHHRARVEEEIELVTHCQPSLSAQVLLGVERELDEPIEELLGRRAREVLAYHLLGVQPHEVAELQRLRA